MYKIREMFVYMSDIEEIFLSDRPQVVNLNKLCAGRKSEVTPGGEFGRYYYPNWPADPGAAKFDCGQIVRPPPEAPSRPRVPPSKDFTHFRHYPRQNRARLVTYASHPITDNCVEF